MIAKDFVPRMGTKSFAIMSETSRLGAGVVEEVSETY
jgi:hypothetical protein